jgi:alpha-D-ribose 1-methylphosphonate 5-triphosphate diphosphatase
LKNDYLSGPKMYQWLPPMRLTGAHVLRDGEFQRRSLSFAEGQITRGPLPEVDLSGYLVLPGIIDLHGDGFERHLSPRPTAPFDPKLGLASADRELAANGITTAWFAQSWSWEGGARGPEKAEALMAALAQYRPQMLSDIRLQIRAETHTIDTGVQLLAAIKRFGIDYVVFNNHLPEAQSMWENNPARLEIWARQSNRTASELIEVVRTATDQAPEVPRHLCQLAEAFDQMGVLYGSHDDPDAETREYYRMLGARIAEFPTSRSAAATAQAMNDPVIMGAPNVVRGGSQSGNIAATALIEDGLCDALVSDYYYPALAEAIWCLSDQGLLSFAKAWAMISTKPAEILELSDRGCLTPGKRADLVVVNPETRKIEATISAGRLIWMAGSAASRFMGMRHVQQLAAE